jgi:hypothetical protein
MNMNIATRQIRLRETPPSGWRRINPFRSALGALFLIASATPVFGADSGPAEPPPVTVRAFDDFKLITQRNIFDTTRRPAAAQRPATSPVETPPPVRTQEFTLTGTLVYDDGAVAFFNGNEADFRKALRQDQTIGGLAIRAIRQNQVTLELDGSEWLVNIGTRLVRKGDEAWTVAAPSESESASPRSRTATRAEPEEDPELDEILQKLMQQRNQELNR